MAPEWKVCGCDVTMPFLMLLWNFCRVLPSIGARDSATMVRVIYDYIELLEVANLSFSTSTRTGLRSRQRHDCGGGFSEGKSGLCQIRCGS